MESAAAVWDAACVRLRDELGWLRTEAWLGRLRLRSLERGAACLEASSPEALEAASPHEPRIRAALAEVLGQEVRVRVLPGRRRRSAAKAERNGGATGEAEGAPALETDRVNPRLQLASFLTGPANEVPLRFALEVVATPGRWAPLVYYGASGSGKTHLLHGIANEYRRRYPARRVVYASSTRFTQQYAFTARRRQAATFRQLYRSADLLLLDDLQDLAGKPGTERELVFTLDHLHARGAQVVLSCSAPPKRVRNLQEALEGRLLGGVVVELPAPDRATLAEIVRARCAASQLTLDEPVLELLGSFGGSVRELLSALTRLEAHRRHVGPRLDLRTVRHLLADLLGQRVQPASLEALTRFVGERLDAPPEQQRGRTRRPRVVRARQLSMALCRELTPLTLREIGEWFGGRSCASVHFAQQKATELRARDAEVREVWEAACGVFTPAGR